MREFALSYIAIILLLASCNRDKQSAFGEMPPLYPAPITVALNTEEGYNINPLTGDSIQPMINSFGDTVITGVPIQAKGKVIHPYLDNQFWLTPRGMPEVVEVVTTKLNVYKIPENLTVIPVDTNSLFTLSPGDVTYPIVLLNSAGDTVPTGVPIPAKGKVVPCIHPKPIKALLPHMERQCHQ